MGQDIVINPNRNSSNSGATIQFTGLASGASTITLGVNGSSGTATDTILSYTTNVGEIISIFQVGW